MTTTTIEILYEDLQKLAKAYDLVRFDLDKNIYKLIQIESVIKECCSTKDLQDRAVASKVLQDTIEELQSIKIIVNKHSEYHIELKNYDNDISVLKKEVNKIKMYSSMIIGGTVALEFFGIIDKVKQSIMG